MSAFTLIMCCPPSHHTEILSGSVEVPLHSLMFISDGQVRYGGYEGGYPEGRRKTIEFVEVAAQGRFGLRSIATPLFSLKNIEGRSEKLLKHVYEELVRLYVDYRRGRILQRVRVKLYGDLEKLKNMGGYAERCANIMEMISDATSLNRSPSVTWWLLAAYDSSALADLGIGGVIRSGMDELATIRLSSLDPHPGVAMVGVTDLGPQMTLDRLETEITELRTCHPALMDTGYSLAFAEDLLAVLMREALNEPFVVVLPVQGSPIELAELAEARASMFDRHGITIEHVSASDATGLRTRTHARARVLIASPTTFHAMATHQEADAWLVPSRAGARACRLPHASLGDANVHLCGSTPEGVASGLCRAIHFQQAHPQLHGRERTVQHEARAAERRREAEHMKAVLRAIIQAPRDSVEVVANRWTGSPAEECHLHWDLAAVRELQLAQVRGLLPPNAKWYKAAVGYAYTAVVTAYRASSDVDPPGEAWESLVGFLSPILMSVACTDEDIFERWEGESEEAQWERCCASEKYLTRRVLDDRYLPVPDIAGWERLLTVASYWETLRADRAPSAHPKVLHGFFQAVADLYAANVRELDAKTRRREVGQVLRGLARHSTLIGGSLPTWIHTRMSSLSLVGPGESGWSQARLELAMWIDLCATRASIAAGIVCRALAMMVPASLMTEEAINQHDRVAAMMDFRFRLANDLASLTDSIEGDRDQKDNAWTILVPLGADGRQREEAIARAVATCQDVLERLDVELDREIAMLAESAPRLACLVSRSVDFGRQAYSGKHYGNLHLADLRRMATKTLRSIGS